MSRKEVKCMKSIYIVTGANGHLGSTIIKQLNKPKNEIRGLILENEEGLFENVTYFKGDVRNLNSLIPLFKNPEKKDIYVIHTAGIISIDDKVSPTLYDVNVNGTKNLLNLAIANNVKRFLYVSSVHAINEGNKFQTITETKDFSPEYVCGAYAKTKAEATKLVLEYVNKGLDAVVVHPSGILGPYNTSASNHLVQLIESYANNKLPAYVPGGYDFVDVRDVAMGCISALRKGKTGECYILSNRHYDIKELLKIIKSIQGGRRIPMIPIWMAKIALPFIRLLAKIRKKRPLYTKYSLYTLTSNDKFDHSKASKYLNFKPRDLYYTIKDTLQWMKKNKNTK